VNHTTETIATLDTNFATCPRNTVERAGQSSMTASARCGVVVLREDVDYSLQLLVVHNQQPVEALCRS
jgi:hypothetical protein